MSADATTPAIVYPESDGKPMADNTLQWDWMVKIVGELREQFAEQEVFVAGDLFWYPVEGQPKVVTAPDALVVFGRPSGYRGSYRQWEEGGIAPQVVFEVLSPNNTDDELDEKYRFYERYGVEEYYFLDPYTPSVEGYRLQAGRLVPVWKMNGFISPRLGVRFEQANGELAMYGPDGRKFLTREERVAEIAEELRKTEMAFEDVRQRAIEESNRADAEQQRADAARSATDALAAKLRELGIDPDQVLREAS